MKYCIKCGKQIEDTSKFCEYCGANVEGNNNQPVQQPMQYQNVQPQQSYEQEKIFYQAKLWRNVEVIISNSKVVVKIKPIFNRSFEEDIIYMKFITAVKTKT
ncbi:MAG: zinc ribbon domain-containing protein, partial [Bacteroidales bacterium]|nr:zinc ribbon domain-containing protein [Bacteroidales bacterium]